MLVAILILKNEDSKKPPAKEKTPTEESVEESAPEVTTEPAEPAVIVGSDPTIEEEILPNGENNEAPVDTGEPVAEAVISEEENAVEPEAIETTTPEPENTVAEESPQEESAIEPPLEPSDEGLTGQATI